MKGILLIAGSIWAYRGVRLVLGVMFAVAGVLKLTAPMEFAIVIDAFGLVPTFMAMPLAYVLPVVEIVAGVGLIFDLKGSLPVVAGLTLLFLAVLGYAMYLGLDIDCGCYGPDDPEAAAFSSLRTSFYRDLLMLAGIVYCYWWRFARRGLLTAAATESYNRIEEGTHA